MTLKRATENLGNSLVQVKGASRKVLFPDLEMKIIRQVKKSQTRKLCISTRWVKVTMMKLVKEHYFVDWTRRRQKSQGFLSLSYLLLALMHCNNFGLKQRSSKKSKSLGEVLLRCRMFHNGLRRKCKTHSGYMFLCDNPNHKYGAFTPE